MIYLMQIVGRPAHVRYQHDARLSDEACKLIEDVVESHGTARSSFKTLLSAMQRVVPAVAHCSWRLVYPGRVKIVSSAYTPLVLVNHRWIVMDDGTLLSADQYHELVREQLIPVTVHDHRVMHGRAGKDLISFIRTIPLVWASRFQIIWHDKTMIELVDTSDEKIFIRFRYDRAVTPALLEKISWLEENLRKRPSVIRAKRGERWCIDVRMHDQIVVARTKG